MFRTITIGVVTTGEKSYNSERRENSFSDLGSLIYENQNGEYQWFFIEPGTQKIRLNVTGDKRLDRDPPSRYEMTLYYN